MQGMVYLWQYNIVMSSTVPRTHKAIRQNGRWLVNSIPEAWLGSRSLPMLQEDAQAAAVTISIDLAQVKHRLINGSGVKYIGR